MSTKGDLMGWALYQDAQGTRILAYYPKVSVKKGKKSFITLTPDQSFEKVNNIEKDFFFHPIPRILKKCRKKFRAIGFYNEADTLESNSVLMYSHSEQRYLNML